MYKLSLAALIVATLTTTAWGQAALVPCGNQYYTLNAAGTRDTMATAGLTCVPSRTTKAGDCGKYAATTRSPNAVCQFIMSKNGYRCCFQLLETTFATPATLRTLASLGPGTTPTPQNQKPICPNGALPTTVSGSNIIRTCNITKSTNQNCPSGYSCVKAQNVIDVYGTLSNPSDDLGAGFTPYLCCKSSTITDKTAVFTEAGLSPKYGTAPAEGIVSVLLAAGNALLSDDWSFVPNQLAALPLSLVLYTAPDITKFYHILYFDSTTDRECAFYPNIVPASASPTLAITAPAVSGSTAPTKFTMVYNAGPASAPVYRWSDGYAAAATDVNRMGRFNTVPKRFAVIIWRTDAALTFAGAGVYSATQLNLLGGTNGDFQPITSTPAGRYVNVSTLVSTRIQPIIGTQPVAGTYFYLMT